MRAGEKRRRRLAAERGDKIYELDRASRRLVGERLALDFPSSRFELLNQVSPRLFYRVRSRWTRPEIDHRLDMGQGLVAGEIFPDFLWRSIRLRAIARR